MAGGAGKEIKITSSKFFIFFFSEMCCFAFVTAVNYFSLQILNESPQSLEVEHTSPKTGKVTVINYEFLPPVPKSFCKIKVNLLHLLFIDYFI